MMWMIHEWKRLQFDLLNNQSLMSGFNVTFSDTLSAGNAAVRLEDFEALSLHNS